MARRIADPLSGIVQYFMTTSIVAAQTALTAVSAIVSARLQGKDVPLPLDELRTGKQPAVARPRRPRKPRATQPALPETTTVAATTTEQPAAAATTPKRRGRKPRVAAETPVAPATVATEAPAADANHRPLPPMDEPAGEPIDE